MLACTGLRISEALALTVQDVDLSQGVLSVRGSKFGHSRWVPLHPSALSPLRRYARQRARGFPQAQAFFVSERGSRLYYGSVNRVFVGLSHDMKPTNGRRHVRLHDLRHTVACRVLLRWQRSRRGAGGRVVILSRYLGHIHLRDTFRLLLRFFKATYLLTPITLELSGLSPERVLAFLAHLERERTNSVRSRNARLAAIRSMTLCAAQHPLGRVKLEFTVNIPGFHRRLRRLTGVGIHPRSEFGLRALLLPR